GQPGFGSKNHRSILTWDDLVTKFINQFFPPSKTTNLRNEITRFQKRFDESFYEAWDRFNDLIRACPHHGFFELHQLDTFYNALNVNDHKVHQSRAKAVVAKVSTSSSTPAVSSEVSELKDMVRALLLDKKNQSSAPTLSSTPAPVKAIERNYVTCGGTHSYQNCPAISENVYRDNIQEYVSQAAFFPPSKTTNLRNEITRFQQRFDESFYEAWERFNDLLRACPHHGFSELYQLDTFYNALNINDQDSLNSAAGGNFLDKMPRECLKIIESKSKVRQSRVKAVVAKVSTSSSTPAISSDVAELKDMIKALLLDKKTNPQLQLHLLLLLQLKQSSQTVHGQSTQNQCQNIQNQYQNLQIQMATLTDMMSKIMNSNTASSSGSGTLPGNTITNLKEELKGITTRSGVAYQGPKTPSPSKQGTEVTKDQVQTPSLQNTAPVQPSVIQSESQALVFEPIVAPVSAPMPNLKPSIPYPSRRDNEKRRDQANEQIEKFYEIFKDMSFEISFTDALTTPMNEHCSAVILNKLPRKLGDPGKFLIPCELPGMDECLALADLGASINLMPFSELKVCEAKTIKSSVDEPPEVELKDLPHHLEYTFLEGDNKMPIIIAKELGDVEKSALKKVLKSHKRAIAWKLSDIQGINPEFCTHKILMEEDYKPAVQHQRRVNPKIYDVIKKEVEKLLDARFIYPISDSPWVSPMLERLAGNEYYCFLDGFSGYFQIPIDPRDQEKTTFTCPYGTFAYRCMPFGLCNAPDTFQRCMFAIFHDMVEKTMEVFMDDFSVFGNSFENYLSRLDKILQRCEDTNLSLNWEKSHFMSFLGHAGFYRRFIQDFSKISRPMTHLLEKNTLFVFSEDCIQAFQTFKKKLTEAPILIASNWDLPFELMCDASDFAIGAVLGKRHEKHFKPIYYASKTMNDVETNYTTTEKEMLAVVYAFENFRSYMIMNKSIVLTDHSALKYLFSKKDAKVKLLRWVLLLQEFDFKVLDTKGAENLAADHLSILENPYENVLDPKDINETFPLETLSMVTFRGDSSAPWIADFANYHAGNFIVKVCEIFDVWGIDFMGPFPSSRGNKYILVVVDYLSKWVEVKSLPTNDARVVCKFLKSLFARFGSPRAIISDRETYFCNDKFTKVMLKYGVTHRLSTAYHPQTSGQVEVSNRGLKRILERTIGENRASWSDKLDDALWAFRTAYKTPIGCTPYKLVYGKACHIQIELEHKAYWALKQANFDLSIAGDHRKVQLNELNELRDHAYENSLIYKEKTKRIHDSKIKNRVFNVGDRVLLFNSRLKIFSGKLKTRWSGPFTTAKVFRYGTVELSQANGPNFKVKGHRVKHYFGGDVPQLVVSDL
nr:reverse transcriptase [Tanacetum cinerariifolium]